MIGGLPTYGAAYNPKTLKTSLISCWEMNDTSGGLADAHASNNLVEGSTSPTYSQTGHIGDSILLNGTTQYFRESSGSNTFNPSSASSHSCWVYKIDSTSITHTLQSRYWSQTGLRIFNFGIVHNAHATVKNRLRYVYWDTADVANFVDYNINGTDLWSDNWMHIVATRSGSTGKLYVNGELVTTNTAGNGSIQQSASTTTYFSIGAVSKSSATPDSFFKGNVDQNAVWSKELTEAEIKFLYNQGSGAPYSIW